MKKLETLGVISETTRKKSRMGLDILNMKHNDDEEEIIDTANNTQPNNVSLRFSFLQNLNLLITED